MAERATDFLSLQALKQELAIDAQFADEDDSLLSLISGGVKEIEKQTYRYLLNRTLAYEYDPVADIDLHKRLVLGFIRDFTSVSEVAYWATEPDYRNEPVPISDVGAVVAVSGSDFPDRAVWSPSAGWPQPVYRYRVRVLVGTDPLDEPTVRQALVLYCRLNYLSSVGDDRGIIRYRELLKSLGGVYKYWRSKK